MSRDAKILDVGCGSGVLAHFWKQGGYSIIGVDLSDKAIEITRNKGVPCKKGDVMKGLPFEDNGFDLVYSDGLLEHFFDPKPVLRELFRVSRKYVLTLVPRICLYNLVAAFILRPPREYKKTSSEWIKLHETLRPKSIRSKNVRFGILSILCRK